MEGGEEEEAWMEELMTVSQGMDVTKDEIDVDDETV